MSPVPDNLYACWRERNALLEPLRERTGPPPEKILQAIWHHQRLLRDELKTVCGKTIRVLHPGFWNREAGPDFKSAVLKIDDEIKTGDVEIDLHHTGWHAHAHDRNPNFKNVVLHIVWSSNSPTGNLPLMALEKFLDAPVHELTRWLGSDASDTWPQELSGQCCAPMRDLNTDVVQELLRQAAFMRLQRKAHEFQFRARQVGWEQAFWEGLFRALGYKQNVWPMQRLGELVPAIGRNGPSVFDLQARLLGISGLLPNDLPRSAEGYVRKVWDIWWRERDAFGETVLPKSVWKFNSLRPANHPQRRLALAAHWLQDRKFLPNLEQWFASDKSKSELLPTLHKLFHVTEDEFWTHHFTLRSATMARPQPLIGEKRITDLAVNVVLPWFWIRAAAGKNAVSQARAERFYFAWPAAEDNSVLRLARRRLLGESRSCLLHTAAAQQGVLQIVRDFCEHSNAVCENCQFPDLIRQINSPTK